MVMATSSSTGSSTKVRTSRRVIVGYEGYILLVCLIQKLTYFVHISHNPMNSDDKYATSCRDPLLKDARNVINLFLDPKMRSTPGVSSIEVMFSAHGDSVWSMLPPRTFSVGFEEQIVVGVMFFTFTDPKIVVKSLFPILYFLKKTTNPMFSRLHSRAVVEA